MVMRMFLIFRNVFSMKVSVCRQLPRCVPRISGEALQDLSQFFHIVLKKFAPQVFNQQMLENQFPDVFFVKLASHGFIPQPVLSQIVHVLFVMFA